MSPESDTTYQARDENLTITAHALPGTARRAQLRLTGDIDLASCPVLSRTVAWLSAVAPVSVVVDLAEVTFASSALPNFVVQVSLSLPGGTEIILWRPGRATRLVLQTTDMAAIATLRDDPLAPNHTSS